MTVAACHKTWNMEHGYLIRRHSGATRFARYIQNHTLEDELNDQLRASRGGPPAYAGLTEAWFDRYDLVKIFGDPTSEGAQGFNAFLEDEKRFIDFTRSSVWAAKEIVFVDEGRQVLAITPLLPLVEANSAVAVSVSWRPAPRVKG